MARLVPLKVDGLIYAISMVMLDSARRKAQVLALTARPRASRQRSRRTWRGV
jgi:hypothetical protein